MSECMCMFVVAMIYSGIPMALIGVKTKSKHDTRQAAMKTISHYRNNGKMALAIHQKYRGTMEPGLQKRVSVPVCPHE